MNDNTLQPGTKLYSITLDSKTHFTLFVSEESGADKIKTSSTAIVTYVESIRVVHSADQYWACVKNGNDVLINMKHAVSVAPMVTRTEKKNE